MKMNFINYHNFMEKLGLKNVEGTKLVEKTNCTVKTI